MIEDRTLCLTPPFGDEIPRALVAFDHIWNPLHTPHRLSSAMRTLPRGGSFSTTGRAGKF